MSKSNQDSPHEVSGVDTPHSPPPHGPQDFMPSTSPSHDTRELLGDTESVFTDLMQPAKSVVTVSSHATSVRTHAKPATTTAVTASRPPSWKPVDTFVYDAPITLSAIDLVMMKDEEVMMTPPEYVFQSRLYNRVDSSRPTMECYFVKAGEYQMLFASGPHANMEADLERDFKKFANTTVTDPRELKGLIHDFALRCYAVAQEKLRHMLHDRKQYFRPFVLLHEVFMKLYTGFEFLMTEVKIEDDPHDANIFRMCDNTLITWLVAIAMNYVTNHAINLHACITRWHENVNLWILRNYAYQDYIAAASRHPRTSCSKKSVHEREVTTTSTTLDISGIRDRALMVRTDPDNPGQARRSRSTARTRFNSRVDQDDPMDIVWDDEEEMQEKQSRPPSRPPSRQREGTPFRGRPSSRSDDEAWSRTRSQTNSRGWPIRTDPVNYHERMPPRERDDREREHEYPDEDTSGGYHGYQPRYQNYRRGRGRY